MQTSLPQDEGQKKPLTFIFILIRAAVSYTIFIAEINLYISIIFSNYGQSSKAEVNSDSIHSI